MSTNKEEPDHTTTVTNFDHVDDANVVQATHVDGTVDLVDRKAVGGELDEMPKGYFRSWRFIGTVTVG